MSTQQKDSGQIGEYIHTETKPLKFLNGADCVHVYQHPQQESQEGLLQNISNFFDSFKQYIYSNFIHSNQESNQNNQNNRLVDQQQKFLKMSIHSKSVKNSQSFNIYEKMSCQLGTSFEQNQHNFSQFITQTAPYIESFDPDIEQRKK